MPIDVIGFAIARAEADKRGLGTQESSRIGVIGAVMPNPIMALVVARSMADREAPPATSQSGEIPTISLVPPRDGTNAGTPGTPGTGTPGTGTPGTGTPGTGDGSNSTELIAHIDDAKRVAEQAKSAADGAVQAVGSLTTKVDEGFKKIEGLIRESSWKSSPAAMEQPSPAQQSTARGKGTGSGDKL